MSGDRKDEKPMKIRFQVTGPEVQQALVKMLLDSETISQGEADSATLHWIAPTAEPVTESSPVVEVEVMRPLDD